MQDVRDVRDAVGVRDGEDAVGVRDGEDAVGVKDVGACRDVELLQYDDFWAKKHLYQSDHGWILHQIMGRILL